MAAARGTSAVVGSASSSLGRHEIRSLAPSTASGRLALSRRWLNSVVQARQASTATAASVKYASSFEAPPPKQQRRPAHTPVPLRKETALPSSPDGNWVKVSGLVELGRSIEHIYSTLLSHQGPGPTQLGTVRVRYMPRDDADSAELHFKLRTQLDSFLALSQTDERLRGLEVVPRHGDVPAPSTDGQLSLRTPASAAKAKTRVTNRPQRPAPPSGVRLKWVELEDTSSHRQAAAAQSPVPAPPPDVRLKWVELKDTALHRQAAAAQLPVPAPESAVDAPRPAEPADGTPLESSSKKQVAIPVAPPTLISSGSPPKPPTGVRLRLAPPAATLAQLADPRPPVDGEETSNGGVPSSQTAEEALRAALLPPAEEPRKQSKKQKSHELYRQRKAARLAAAQSEKDVQAREAALSADGLRPRTKVYTPKEFTPGGYVKGRAASWGPVWESSGRYGLAEPRTREARRASLRHWSARAPRVKVYMHRPGGYVKPGMPRPTPRKPPSPPSLLDWSALWRTRLSGAKGHLPAPPPPLDVTILPATVGQGHWIRISDLPPIDSPEAFQRDLIKIVRQHAPPPRRSKSPLGAVVHAKHGMRTVYLEFAPEPAAKRLRVGPEGPGQEGQEGGAGGWHTEHRALHRLLRACSLHRPFDNVEIELSGQAEFDRWQVAAAYPTGRRTAYRF